MNDRPQNLEKRVGRQPSRVRISHPPADAEQGRQGRASSTFLPGDVLAQPGAGPVRPAMTTVTPGVKAALICPAACSAVAALIWAGKVTMTGGAQVSWPGMSVPLLLAGRGATRRAARPAAGMAGVSRCGRGGRG